jgi:hypothetical protein
MFAAAALAVSSLAIAQTQFAQASMYPARWPSK